VSAVQVQDLIEAGVHFGHRVSRWHPKMRNFIFGKRNLIHIIDIRQTIRGLVRASNFLTQIVTQGKDVVFVGTKRQAKSLVQREAKRCGMHYIAERWLGGTLTNYHTIRSRLKRLEELEELEQTGRIEDYSKKRISSLRRERRKITRNLEGIRNMKQLPGCLVVIDIRREYIAVREARKCGIPVIGLVDTDCDPTDVDIVIPGNDDAYRAIQQVLRILTDAAVAGRDKYVAIQAEQAKARLEEEARAKAEAAKQAEAARKAAAAAKQAKEAAAKEAKQAREAAAAAKAAAKDSPAKEAPAKQPAPQEGAPAKAPASEPKSGSAGEAPASEAPPAT
jgi:small subunit ribosomal protein S2